MALTHPTQVWHLASAWLEVGSVRKSHPAGLRRMGRQGSIHRRCPLRWRTRQMGRQCAFHLLCMQPSSRVPQPCTRRMHQGAACVHLQRNRDLCRGKETGAADAKETLRSNKCIDTHCEPFVDRVAAPSDSLPRGAHVDSQAAKRASNAVIRFRSLSFSLSEAASRGAGPSCATTARPQQKGASNMTAHSRAGVHISNPVYSGVIPGIVIPGLIRAVVIGGITLPPCVPFFCGVG